MRIGIDIPQDLPLRRQAPQPDSTPRPEEPGSIQRSLSSVMDRTALDRHSTIISHPAPSRAMERDRELAALQQRDRDPENGSNVHILGSDRILFQTIDFELRPEERKIMLELGRFRIIRTHDLSEAIYGGKERKLEEDLRDLRSKGLMEMRQILLRADRNHRRVRRVKVATLTRDGYVWLEKSGEVPQGQTVYYGFVKPREMEHDSLIYRAYCDAAQRIESDGGSNLRIKLDFEIKAEIQKDIYPARKADPKRDMVNLKQEIAAKHSLPFVNGGIQIPDARIEFDRKTDGVPSQASGSRIGGHEDIEVVTAAYQRRHLRAKVQAGFRTYASASDRSSITAKIEDEQHMMQDILDL